MIYDRADALSSIYISFKHFIFIPLSFVYIVKHPNFNQSPGNIFVFCVGRMGWFPIALFVLCCELTDNQVPAGTWSREAINWLTFRKGLSDMAKSAITIPYSLTTAFAVIHMIINSIPIENIFIIIEVVEYLIHIIYFTLVKVDSPSSRIIRVLPPARIHTRTIIVQQISACDQLALPEINNNASLKKIYNNEASELCSICLDSIIKGSIYFETRCNHLYHYKCIQEWSKQSNSCPICRQILI